jgi:hypothetical protein
MYSSVQSYTMQILAFPTCGIVSISNQGVIAWVGTPGSTVRMYYPSMGVHNL